LLATVTLADWLGRRRGFRHAGAAVLAIGLGALLANLGVLPVAHDGVAAYDMVFALVTPAAIFLVLLEANLGALRQAGPRMLLAFALGAVGTVAGVLVATAIVPLDIGDRLAPLAGMFAATYIGGSANFNAVAIEYGMSGEGTLYTAAIVADNVMTMVWIVVTLLLPTLMRFRRRSATTCARLRSADYAIADTRGCHTDAKRAATVTRYAGNFGAAGDGSFNRGAVDRRCRLCGCCRMAAAFDAAGDQCCVTYRATPRRLSHDLGQAAGYLGYVSISCRGGRQRRSWRAHAGGRPRPFADQRMVGTAFEVGAVGQIRNVSRDGERRRGCQRDGGK